MTYQVFALNIVINSLIYQVLINVNFVSFLTIKEHPRNKGLSIDWLAVRSRGESDLETATTTLAALLNTVRGRLCLAVACRCSGEGQAPIRAMRASVVCSQSWNPPSNRRRYFFWQTRALRQLSSRRYFPYRRWTQTQTKGEGKTTGQFIAKTFISFVSF